ncbi:hypothetical protein DFH09DRAFT_471072 [Mycena vulgaris]|nr:hypothetical protein DFH09DRAFT_471072 [Mycena vulgaris]
MADLEFRAPAREPTFVKPLDTASHRRSRVSHDSAAASTRSWVLMNAQSPPPPAEAIPLPEPVPVLTARPLPEPPRRVDEAGAEHMAVELPSAAEVGYQWNAGKSGTHREGKGFVGGFVSGLRRLPRALVRTRRPRRGTTGTEGTEGTEGTGMSGNTLPRYVSTPPTPVVADASVDFVRGGGLAAPAAVGNESEGRRRRPTFRVMPLEEDVRQGIATPIVRHSEHGDGEAMPGALEFPQAPMENPYDREPPAHHAAPPPEASPHPSRGDDHLTAPADVDGDEPVSIHTRSLPTEDYRRMSAHDVSRPHSRTTINSGSFSADSPSFSSELNGFHRFFNALHLLPWVATDRVTADYRPKAKSKNLVSWYHPEGTTPATPALNTSSSPESVPGSARSPPRHRSHRRATTSGDSPTPPAAYGQPFAYYPAFSPPSPPTPRSRRPMHAPSRSARSQVHRHHRRSATYHGPAQWVPPPMLPAPPTPVYFIQASPAPSPTPTPLPDASPGRGDSPAQKHVAQMLAPVYMQMQGGGQLAVMQGGSGYAYAYSSPIAMPAPAQSVYDMDCRMQT